MSEDAISRANAAALARMHSVRPAWCAVRTAREALGLEGRVLLHAGPPLGDPARLPAPILSSAVLCCLYEGWATDEASAEALIEHGMVALRPAQDFGAVTPLAAVISPRSMLVEVCDLTADNPRRAWSLLGSGAGPQIRFGTRQPAVIERLAWRDEVLGPQLAQALSEGPLALGPCALAGLAAGDDLHARCTGASTALHAALVPRLAALPDCAAINAMLAATPLFFLTLWMAACHLALDTAADGGRDAQSTLVVGFAGNGRECGIRLAGDPQRWWTAAAAPPAGPFLNPENLALAAPMVGDSGAIDAAGFGAYALAGAAAELLDAVRPWLPADWRETARTALLSPPPADDTLPWAALDATRVANRTDAAHALIAMLDRDGRQGLLGRGVFAAPRDAFREAAWAALSGETCHG